MTDACIAHSGGETLAATTSARSVFTLPPIGCTLHGPIYPGIPDIDAAPAPLLQLNWTIRFLSLSHWELSNHSRIFPVAKKVQPPIPPRFLLGYHHVATTAPVRPPHLPVHYHHNNCPCTFVVKSVQITPLKVQLHSAVVTLASPTTQIRRHRHPRLLPAWHYMIHAILCSANADVCRST